MIGAGAHVRVRWTAVCRPGSTSGTTSWTSGRRRPGPGASCGAPAAVPDRDDPPDGAERVPAALSGRRAVRARARGPGPAWRAHPRADGLIAPGRLPEAGPDAWVALRRLHSTFDDQVGLRPYVFDLGPDGVDDRWRGTALSSPIALAAAVDGGLCALLRGDSFLRPDPANAQRTWTRWRWNGFGFSSVGDADVCLRLDTAGILAR